MLSASNLFIYHDHNTLYCYCSEHDLAIAINRFGAIVVDPIQ